MNPRSRTLPVRILKLWFEFVLVLGTLAGSILFLSLCITPFLMAGGDHPADAGIKVVIGERSWAPVYPVTFRPTDPSTDPRIERAGLVGTRGELRFRTTNWRLHLFSLIGFSLAVAVVLYIIWILRRVLINVLEGHPFDPANGRLLGRCGYIILVGGAVVPTIDFAFSSHVLSQIEVTSVSLKPAITFDPDVFVVGLLFLVFAAILTHGHELEQREQALEEEQALTV